VAAATGVQAFREFKSIWDPQWKMNPAAPAFFHCDQHVID
jgi:hypothetical protein